MSEFDIPHDPTGRNDNDMARYVSQLDLANPPAFLTEGPIVIVRNGRVIEFPRDFIKLEEHVADLVSLIDELQSQIYELYVPNGPGALQAEHSFTSKIESQSLDEDE